MGIREKFLSYKSITMDFIRTPDSQFENIKDWKYKPNYIQLDNGLRMHYVDEGEGEVILLMHGEPSWAYLYRKMIPILSKKYRVVVPDLIGFGRSDKPTKKSDYTFAMHFNVLEEFIMKTKLSNITVVVQDWGGLLGLGVLGKHPHLFSRAVIMNTYLPTGESAPAMAFKIWRAFSQFSPVFNISSIIKMGCYSKLDKETLAAYDAPFPSSKYKAGARKFPVLVPMKPTDEGVAEMKRAREVLKEWDKPVLIMFSDKDPITKGGEKWFFYNILKANPKDMITIKGGGHFLQEDKGEEIAQNIDSFMSL